MVGKKFITLIFVPSLHDSCFDINESPFPRIAIPPTAPSQEQSSYRPTTTTTPLLGGRVYRTLKEMSFFTLFFAINVRVSDKTPHNNTS
jgi:hypothetical protein